MWWVGGFFAENGEGEVEYGVVAEGKFGVGAVHFVAGSGVDAVFDTVEVGIKQRTG